MKIGTAQPSFSPFRQAIRVTHVESLHVTQANPDTSPEKEAHPGPLALHPGAKLFVPRKLEWPEAAAPLSAPPSPAGSAAMPQRTEVTLAHATKNFGIGAGMAATTMTVIPLARAASVDQISTQLSNYGFAPSASEQLATQGIEFARSNAGHLTALFLAGTTAGVGIVEALRPDWPWGWKLLAAAGLGLVLLIAGGVASYFGVWGGADAVPGKPAVVDKPVGADKAATPPKAAN